jgi:hypothetical protein
MLVGVLAMLRLVSCLPEPEFPERIFNVKNMRLYAL